MARHQMLHLNRARLNSTETQEIMKTKNRLKLASSAKLMVEDVAIESPVEINHDSEMPAECENGTTIQSEQSEPPETPKKRGRGRPRKGEGLRKPVEAIPRRNRRRQELEKRREEKETLQRETELLEIQLKRKQRILQQEERARNKRRKLEERNAVRVEQGLEPLPIDNEIPLPKKRMYSPRKPPSPKNRPRQNSSGSPEKRSKAVRPSKLEKVTKHVVSIFQMDDMEIFQDRKTVSPEKRLNDTKSPAASSPIPLDFDTKSPTKVGKISTLSGIRRAAPKPVSEPDISEAKKFTSFPVPEVDEDGNLKDHNFIKTHLSQVAVSFDPNARLTDERAFFLQGSEGYFEQHSLRFKPSTNSLVSNAPPLDYEDFIPIVTLGLLIHRDEKEAVKKRQKELFHQWCFELSQGYNLNLFGVGSKASIMMDFLEDYFLNWYTETVQDDNHLPGVMVINGYNPSAKLKTVLQDMASVVVADEDTKGDNFRMPKHVSEAFSFVVSHLKKNVTQSTKSHITKPRLLLITHNIDGEAFRDDQSQNILSQLAALPNVWLLLSTDTINVGLLWDLYRFKNFNFLWHEVTTYEAFGVEMSFKDVLSTGKSKSFVGSKGAKYVLASLPTNAKNLYKVVSTMQLEKFDQAMASKAACTGLRATAKLGMELKAVYEKCVQEYIASNEINFKTMLGEFVEHKMCSLAKNTAGADIVFIPFTYDEIEKLLEDEL